MSAAVAGVLPYAKPGRVLIVNSPLFGAVSMSLAWVSEGRFTLSTERPAAYDEELGGGWAIERRWGVALAVSLPDGVHVLNPTDVSVALHLAGEPLEHRMPADVLARLLVQGISLVGVEEIRRISAAWRSCERDNSRAGVTAWRRELRKVWGSRKRHDRAITTMCALIDAVQGPARPGVRA
jgi:hypothetical protein